uniref:Fructose-2 6-bisphosphatase n=1 Tax=Rhizophora mucronata TaxID=61149 RepID=A0A2P2MUW1_RHIMU
MVTRSLSIECSSKPIEFHRLILQLVGELIRRIFSRQLYVEYLMSASILHQ